MTIKRKLTIATAAALFFVLAGTGVASALWSTPASVSSSVKVASLAQSCTVGTVRSMLNAGFEKPAISTDIGYASGTDVRVGTRDPMEGWRSRTNNGAVSPIEIWSDGARYDGLPAVRAVEGRQFVELNADAPGTLYQQLATIPGQTMQWSFLHRGRMGPDSMELLIGAPGNPIRISTFVDSYQSPNSNQGWVRYSGTYVVPVGQEMTELGFKSLATGSIGNFLDDVSFGTGPCVTATSTASNTAPKALNAPIYVGDTVTYSTTIANSGSSPAVASMLNWSIPAGLSYQAGSLTVGDVASGAVTGNTALNAPFGVGASAGVGGSLAQGASVVVSWKAKVTAAAGTVLNYTPTITYSNGLATGWSRTLLAADVPITVVSDTEKPSVSGTPVASATTATQATLTWTASTDNVAVVDYYVLRNGVRVGTVSATTARTATFTDPGFVAWSNTVYTIQANDAAGNFSVSAPLSITPPGGLAVDREYRLTPANNTSACLVGGTNGLISISTTASTCRTSDNSRDWMFVSDNAGNVKIKTGVDRYLTAESNSAAGTAILNANSAALGQTWTVTASAAGVQIQSRSNSGYCLTYVAATWWSSAGASLSRCDGGSDQVWIGTLR